MLTGAGRYSADWNLPGQVHGLFLRADRAHADITAIDLAAARGAAGVLAVLTGEDAAATGFDRNNTMIPVKGVGGQSFVELRRPVLAMGRVRYVGEPVALVVAETAAQAQDAAELIAIEYENRAVVPTVEAAVAYGAALLHDAAAGNFCFEYAYGDPAATEAAFARAADVVRLDLRGDRVVGNPMEPKAALAAWTDGVLDIWTSTQGMLAFRDSLAMMTGLDPASIRVRAQEVGGGFGLRGSAYPEQCRAGAGGAADGAAGEVGGEPVGDVPQRLSRARAGDAGRSGAGRGGAVPGDPARVAVRPGGVPVGGRAADQHAERAGDVHRVLPGPRRIRAYAARADQHGTDHGLSRGGAAGHGVCDRAAGRRGGAADRAGPDRAAAAERGAAGGLPISPAGRNTAAATMPRCWHKRPRCRIGTGSRRGGRRPPRE